MYRLKEDPMGGALCSLDGVTGQGHSDTRYRRESQPHTKTHKDKDTQRQRQRQRQIQGHTKTKTKTHKDKDKAKYSNSIAKTKTCAHTKHLDTAVKPPTHKDKP